MGNAVSGLKDRGWTMTGDNDHEGVVEAIRRFVLRR
jgi:hydroxymethylpyrimidine pyrophosphatase-like HAD family hydrolase